MLHDFIRQHREELIARTRSKVALRSAPRATEDELENGVPRFLSQLEGILVDEASGGQGEGERTSLALSATIHGRELLQSGFSVGQVVHGYGDVCQAVTELLTEHGGDIGVAEFRILNRSLDDAIASAVTEYTSAREARTSLRAEERVGSLAHELRNALNSCVLAFQALKRGQVGVHGSTAAVLESSLTAMSRLVDRSLADVRLSVGIVRRERMLVSAFVEHLGIAAALEAEQREMELTIDCAERTAEIEVDGLLLGSAVSNLVHNALKFTRPHGHVCLRVGVRNGRALIEVQDQCGGLAPGAAEQMFEPFHQSGTGDRSLGLGLTISRHAIEASGGTVSVRTLPGEGCVFAIELPLAVEAPGRPTVEA